MQIHNEISQENILLTFFFYFLVSELFLLISYYFYRIYNKVKLLAQNVEYDNEFFVNYSYSYQVISDFIKDHNIEIGIVAIFSFNGYENLNYRFGKKAFNKIEQQVLNVLKNDFDLKKTIFFKTFSNHFACFIDLSNQEIDLKKIYEGNNLKSRSLDDPLFFLEKITTKVPTDLDYNHQSVKVNLKFFASLYNIHSNNFDELVHNCEIFEKT